MKLNTDFEKACRIGGQMSRMVYEGAAYVAFLGLTRVQALRAESIEDRLTALRETYPSGVCRVSPQAKAVTD
jgi:hypothetical protein